MSNLAERAGRATPRRSILKGAIGAWAATLAGAALGATDGLGLANEAGRLPVTRGDVNILRFLAAAELIEEDLWQQYCELGEDNPAYNEALETIEDEIVDYACDVTRNERSHHQLINGFLSSTRRRDAVDLDRFRTLPSSPATGAKQVGRLTNLRNLNVDTSWFLRYRDPGNPDFGATYPQFVQIAHRPTIPLSDDLDDLEIQAIANSAAFHFAAIEQGGASLYTNVVARATSLTVVRLIAGIGPTEAYHFASFHQSLEGLPPLDTGDGLVFPDLRDTELSAHHIPVPCRFLSEHLPLCAVIRPASTPKAGAMAAASAFIDSNLFEGQSQEFFDLLRSLARAADAAMRLV
jgi:hypothetical protein